MIVDEEIINAREAAKGLVASNHIRDRRITGLVLANEVERLRRELGNLKAAFRVNMLRLAPQGLNVDAEIDRVFEECRR